VLLPWEGAVREGAVREGLPRTGILVAAADARGSDQRRERGDPVKKTIEPRSATSDEECAHHTSARTADGAALALVRGYDNRLPLTALAPAAHLAPCADARTEPTITLAVGPISSVCGRSMTFTAAVAAVPPDSGTPTGTVNFSADGRAATPVTLSGGVATFTTRLDAGEHTVTASYAGDAHFHATARTTLTTRIWRHGFDDVGYLDQLPAEGG
jgi:hypothetical protein